MNTKCSYVYIVDDQHVNVVTNKRRRTLDQSGRKLGTQLSSVVTTRSHYRPHNGVRCRHNNYRIEDAGVCKPNLHAGWRRQKGSAVRPSVRIIRADYLVRLVKTKPNHLPN